MYIKHHHHLFSLWLVRPKTAQKSKHPTVDRAVTLIVRKGEPWLLTSSTKGVKHTKSETVNQRNFLFL